MASTSKSSRRKATKQTTQIARKDCPSQASSTAEVDDNGTAAHGISILKEIFPDHSQGGYDMQKLDNRPTTPSLDEIVARLPSPARQGQVPAVNRGLAVGAQWNTGGQNGNVQWNAASAPPKQQGLLLSQPHQSQQWEPPQVPAPESSVASYRERLRSSGRASFQRTAEAGFVPKIVKQDHIPASNDQYFWPQQQADMQYDNQMMWCQHAENECWGTSMDQTQMGVQYPYMVSQSPDFMQMAPMVVAQEPDMQQMAMPMAQMQTPILATSGESMPADFDRYMAIVMPGAEQSQEEKDFLALQLRAAAEECQCYED